MDRKAEVLTMLKIPDIDFFIPSSPLSFDPMKDEMVNGRHWVIQGETLQFYMVIRLSRLLIRQVVSSEPGAHETPSSGVISESPVSPASVTATTPVMTVTNFAEDAFVPREWEDSDSESGGYESVDMLETSKGRSSVNLEILQSPTFRMRLRELLSKLEIIIEFLKGRSKIKSARQASSSATTDVSPVSVDIRHVFQPSEESFKFAEKKCFSLPNGDIVYPLITDVSIKTRYVGHHISLAVAIYPPETEMSINQLISPVYVERSAIRMVAVPILVVEPVSPVITTKQVGSVMYASVSITNNHNRTLTLEDAHLNLYDIRKPDSPLSSFEYHNNYEIELYKDSFPFHLEPTEQYSFVTSIAAVASNLMDEDHSISNTAPELQLKWHTQDLCGSMLTPMKIPFPKSEGKLIITFDTGEQPIRLHTIFPISLTIYNLSKQARDIILEIPLIKFEGQSERFFADASFSSPLPQFPTKQYTRLKGNHLDLNSHSNVSRSRAASRVPSTSNSPAQVKRSEEVPKGDSTKNKTDATEANANGKGADSNNYDKSPQPTDFIDFSATADSVTVDLNDYNDTNSNTPDATSDVENLNIEPEASHKSHDGSSYRRGAPRKTKLNAYQYPITNQRFETWDKTVNIFEPPASTFKDYEDSKQNVASVMCLEKVIYLGNIAANSQATTRIECVAMSQGLFTLKEVKAIDTIGQKEFVVKEGCQIYIT